MRERTKFLNLQNVEIFKILKNLEILKVSFNSIKFSVDKKDHITIILLLYIPTNKLYQN